MLRNPLTIAVILMSNMPRNSDFHLPNTRVIYPTTSKRNVPVFPRNERQLQHNTHKDNPSTTSYAPMTQVTDTESYFENFLHIIRGISVETGWKLMSEKFIP